MLPALQPSRPRPSQPIQQPTYTHQQQRAIYEQPHSPPPKSPSRPSNAKLWKQTEAMSPSHPVLYNPAIRHPVFFTNQLRKPPFPLPEIASRGWSPVAAGYVEERKKGAGKIGPVTKL